MQTPCRRSSKAGRKVLDLCLTVVIFEPGYGSGKQGKERVFITTDELAKIRGYIANIARQDLSQPISVGGVFSFDMHSNEWQGYAVNSTPNQSDIIRFAAGEDRPHNNLQPSLATYCWRRQA